MNFNLNNLVSMLIYNHDLTITLLIFWNIDFMQLAALFQHPSFSDFETPE